MVSLRSRSCVATCGVADLSSEKFTLKFLGMGRPPFNGLKVSVGTRQRSPQLSPMPMLMLGHMHMQ